jgi:hypothetical protein
VNQKFENSKEEAMVRQVKRCHWINKTKGYSRETVPLSFLEADEPGRSTHGCEF